MISHVRSLRSAALLAALAASTTNADDDRAAPPVAAQVSASSVTPAETAEKPQAEELTPEAQAALHKLESTLGKDSEARAMLEEILGGSRLGPDDGWFKVALPQARYHWDAVKAQFDADQDGTVSRDEFPGDDEAFATLDRTRDKQLSADDLDWSTASVMRSAAAPFFYRADRDGNGKLTLEELQQRFAELDDESAGYISLDEIWNAVDPPVQPPRSEGPSRSTLVLGLLSQEIGSLQPGPNVGEKAPDFTLTALSGEKVTLSEQIGPKPLVLIFGNFTCGPFRSQSGNIEKFVKKYEGRANFLLVYVREAHPADGWHMTSNQRVGIHLPQPQTNQARREVAQQCQERLDLQIPFLVDTVDDTVGARYSGMPNRLYLIDQQGTIVFKNGRGPFGFKIGELEQQLVLHLTGERGPSNP